LACLWRRHPPDATQTPARPPALLQELSEEELVRVLTEPRHALLKQYSELFRQSHAEFK
jgi:ATP-dependent protease Clp ATPase subunit